MITVAGHLDYLSQGLDPRYFFDINGDEYRFVTDSDQPVDILLQNNSTIANIPCKIQINLDIWHGKENQIPLLEQSGYTGNRYVITVAEHDPTAHSPNIIKLAFAFNRTRAYYTQFPFSPGLVPYYWQEGAFRTPMISDSRLRKKIFLSPCRTWFENAPDRTPRARQALANLMRSRYLDRGYLGNVTPDHPRDWLYPQVEFPEMHDFDHGFLDYRHGIKPDLTRSDWHGYSPPHNAYYTNTFVSIYGETIEYGTSTIVSEKTWDPLIKGHFILPFSNPGFIQYLRTWNIRFPDFIDYSYDTIEDYDHRLSAWLDEIQRLMSLPLETWREHWDRNLVDIVYQNQRVLYSTDYRKVDLKRLLQYNV